MVKSDRPRQPRRITGKWWALLLAIAVQLGFLAVLVFSVQWQNRKPEPVTAELYAPPVKAPVVEEPPPPPPQPAPQPAPPPKPEPVVEKPDPHAAEIALKAKQDDEKKKKAEADKRARDAKEAKDAEDKRKFEEKRLADLRERQQRETVALRAQAEREAQVRAQADREAAARAAAEAGALSKAEADWIRRIQAKVRGNVVVPSDLPGNPEAIFEVVQLPTGEIIDATLRKSSGNRAYDEAVQRAILKSSPLPRPERADLFQRNLTLKFRPQD